MATKPAIATLVLRILAIALLAASVAIFVTNKFTTSDGEKTTFTSIQAYKYVISAALLGFVYSVLQLPFAAYHVKTEKRLIRGDWLPVFESYADQIVAYILATAVGAGFAITVEYKKRLPDFIILLQLLGAEGLDEEKSKGGKFLDKGNIATGVLGLGFICVAVQAVISSISRNSRTTTKGRGFFG